jgi:hypothetical protein
VEAESNNRFEKQYLLSISMVHQWIRIRIHKKKILNFRAPRDFVDHDFAVDIIRYQKPLNGSCLGIISKKKLSFPPLALVCNRLVHIYVEIKFDGAMMLVAEQVILLEVEKLPKICVGAGQVAPASFLQTGSF